MTFNKHQHYSSSIMQQKVRTFVEVTEPLEQMASPVQHEQSKNDLANFSEIEIKKLAYQDKTPVYGGSLLDCPDTLKCSENYHNQPNTAINDVSVREFEYAEETEQWASQLGNRSNMSSQLGLGAFYPNRSTACGEQDSCTNAISRGSTSNSRNHELHQSQKPRQLIVSSSGTLKPPTKIKTHKHFNSISGNVNGIAYERIANSFGNN